MEPLNKLIEIMCSELVLALPNFDLDFKVTSDSSDLRYGAVQDQEIDEKERSISYFSIPFLKRIIQHRKRNYSALSWRLGTGHHTCTVKKLLYFRIISLSLGF